MRSPWLWGGGLWVCLCGTPIAKGAAQAEPATCDNLQDPKLLRKIGGDEYQNTKKPLSARLLAAEQCLQKSLGQCGEDADCYNLTHFGLACVNEDQYRLLEKDKPRADAEQKLLAALNAYERYISQRAKNPNLATELSPVTPRPLAPTELACPPRSETPTNLAVAGRARLAALVRATHGRLILQFPTQALSFRLNNQPFVIVKRPERPLPVWLPQGEYPISWNNDSEHTLVKLRAGETVAVFLGPQPKPAEPPAAVSVPPVETLAQAQPPALPSELGPSPSGRAYFAAGGTLLAVGAAATGLGVSGLVLDGRCHDAACQQVYDGKTFGAALLGVGVAAVGIGISMLAVGAWKTRKVERKHPVASLVADTQTVGVSVLEHF